MFFLAKDAASNLAATLLRSGCATGACDRQALRRAEVLDFHVAEEPSFPSNVDANAWIETQLSDGLPGPSHALTPVPHLLIGFSVRDSICLLDFACEPLTIAGNLFEIVVGELAPIFLGRTD
jgi:hypothetical protein